MVVTNGIRRAIQYYYAIRGYLTERKSHYQAIVAFSGEKDYGGEVVTEASVNGFRSAETAERFQQDPYRFLVCSDKVPDRLRRATPAHPLRRQAAARGQGGSGPVVTQPGALEEARCLGAEHPERHGHHQRGALKLPAHHDPSRRDRPQQAPRPPSRPGRCAGVLARPSQWVRQAVSGRWDGDQFDPILDRCVEAYTIELDEDKQVAFKSGAEAIVRTYAFLSSILPYNNQGWEERSIFLNFLIPKLPSPMEDDSSKGIPATNDMDSYWVEKRAMQAIILADDDREVGPVPTGRPGGKREVEIDLWSVIIAEFNDLFGGIAWQDADRVH